MIPKSTVKAVMDSTSVLKIKEWSTPATSYELHKFKEARLTRKNYHRGFYYMFGVDGYELFYVENPIPVTCLHIGKEEVMVDDPLHWIGMQRLAEACHGDVLCAGLGLGLVQHALHKNPKVKTIATCEINHSVYQLVRPMVDIGNLYVTDVYEYLKETKHQYACIILDTWWGEGTMRMRDDMLARFAQIKCARPNTEIFIWGVRNPTLNPAVKKS